MNVEEKILASDSVEFGETLYEILEVLRDESKVLIRSHITHLQYWRKFSSLKGCNFYVRVED